MGTNYYLKRIPMEEEIAQCHLYNGNMGIIEG